MTPTPARVAARRPLPWARIRSTARDLALVIGFVLFVSAGPHAHPPVDTEGGPAPAVSAHTAVTTP